MGFAIAGVIFCTAALIEIAGAHNTTVGTMFICIGLMCTTIALTFGRRR
ncbi:MAG TPA: hypothetical protein VLF67_00630 [Candidatus Saccharimonas sp.]|nr:hypothetical protein [Candidatus Saccharimonas sp.]